MQDFDAALERQQELVSNIKIQSRRRGGVWWATLVGRLTCPTGCWTHMCTQKVPVDEDMQYTVFVSYMEIYNNYKCNPKLDMVTDGQKLASKIPRVGACP